MVLGRSRFVRSKKIDRLPTLIKAKEEALRIKKKIEGDINEMEISLDHANKSNAETSKQIKRLAVNLLEIDTTVEEEARARADVEDQIGISERKGKTPQCGKLRNSLPHRFYVKSFLMISKAFKQAF